MHLSKCIGPAAVECLFEGLHGNSRPTYDDFTYCLDACDATRVLELPIDAALCHADAPLELAARMREALSIAFKPVSCVGGGGGSSTGPITIIVGQESVNLSGASLDYFWSQPSGPPLFVRVGLLTQDMIDREIALPEGITKFADGDDDDYGDSHGAFSGCSSLSQIELPASLTSLGDNAFQGCSSLSEAMVPAGLKIIKDTFPSATKITKLKKK